MRRPAVLVLGPSRDAISGVTTHVNSLLDSRLAGEFALEHFQVGSEGRAEGAAARWLRLAASPFALAAAVLRRGAAVVHLNTSLNAKAWWRDLVYLLVAKACGARVVLQVHGGALDRFVYVLRAALRWPDAVVVLSRREQDSWRRLVPEQSVALLPNGIDCAPYLKYSRRAPAAAEPLRLAHIGPPAPPKRRTEPNPAPRPAGGRRCVLDRARHGRLFQPLFIVVHAAGDDMGAIAGWASNEARDEAALAPMLERLAHRAGATELSGFVDRRANCQVVLGASLYDAQARIAVVLDGAIANRDELRAWLSKRSYAFPDQTDAEVLLRAYQYWDKDAIKHLRGGFAFAIWDGRKERLLLARDRFGEKPLYLREADGALHFASEPKALATANAEIDLEAVWEHLACRYVPGPRTLVKGIRKLAPASYALWQFRKLRETRYWTPPDRAPHFQENIIEDPVAGFIERLDQAVKLALPGGVFLSGGIDSAAIVALATQQGARLATFSAGFAEDKASELPAAARPAKHFGTAHHELTISRRDLIDRLPRLVAMRDAPLSRPSDVALHLLAVHAARVTPAVLTGAGGDEVLGGHRRHAAERFAWAFRGLPTVLALFSPLTSASPRLRAAAASLPLEDWRERSLRWNGGLTRDERERLSVLGLNGSSLESFGADPMASRLRQMLYFEQMSSLPDNLLERADRVTMAASGEAR